MLQLTVKKIAEIVSGELTNKFGHDPQISEIIFDSRNIHFTDSVMFVALKGKRRDGHQFIVQAYEAGIRIFLVSAADLFLPDDAVIIKVSDTLTALQRIAIFHRHLFDIPVVGITGSNGKTIVKEWLTALLQGDLHVLRSPKSYNSQLGVPLSVFQLSASYDIAIFEAGVSTKDEMAKLEKMIHPNIGIFTNLGKAHQEGFNSLSEKLIEKSLLFENCNEIIFEHTEQLALFFSHQFPDKRLFTWSKEGHDADVVFKNLQIKENGSEFLVNYRGESGKMHVAFKDPVYLHNCFTCITFLFKIGWSIEKVAEKITLLQPLPMRLEIRPGLLNSLLIDDTYNADLDSLQSAFLTCMQIEPQRKKIFILSDIFQAGIADEILYQKLAGNINEFQPDKVIGIGNKIGYLRNYLKDKIHFIQYATGEDFITHFDISAIQQTVILIKGSRQFNLEKVTEWLSYNRHQTRLEINLNAISHNIREYGNLLSPGTKLMVMVKASAYGSGAIEVARLLELQKVDYLAVAYAEEGIEIREAGIRLPIMVMSTGNIQFDRLLGFNLEPEIFSLAQLQALDHFLKSQDANMTIHIKLDTGMHRLGFIENDLDELIEIINSSSRFKIASIFSHLAASGEELHDSFTIAQAEKFQELASKVSNAIGYQPMRHILNSSGIIRFPQYQFEICRLGIGLYGIDPSDKLPGLQTVLSLKTSITQIKELNYGDTVGYSRNWKATEKSRIATIAIGYADGLRRAAGNSNWHVMIHQKAAPVIGNVCMDMCMVDITHITEAKEGDEVVIFGREPSVMDLAKICNTISYEILTGISQRVRRIYVME